MKKVLFLIPSLAHGGAEKVLVNLVNNMDKSKFDITVQTIFDVGINKQFLSKNIKYKTHYKKQFPGNSKYLCLYSPEKLFKKFIKAHYDVIVSYLEGPTARIVSGCTDEDTKLVSWIHCRMETEKEAYVGFRSFIEAKKCYGRFDNTVCVSKMTMNYFKNTMSFDRPIEVLYNTIETDEVWKKSLEPVEDVVFENDVFNICSVGKVTKVKGFERLASIHKRLLDNGINNHIYILGIGEQQAEIERHLSENNIDDTFTFLGYRTNPYKYVAKCDLYVCSSYSEGFSTSVTEALIAGTPIVTTNVSGMTEMLGENNEYGIVTENSEESLYNGIKTMLTTAGMLEEYAVKAKERGKDFSTEKTTKAVENMLIKLCEKND